MTEPRVQRIDGRAGHVEITELDNILLVRPRGYVGRKMLLHGLQEATSFGNSRPEGWYHVTDASRFVVPNPVNPLVLRRIQNLPNMRGYLLIVPSRLWRSVAGLWRRIIRADAVVESFEAAQEWISRRD